MLTPTTVLGYEALPRRTTLPQFSRNVVEKPAMEGGSYILKINWDHLYQYTHYITMYDSNDGAALAATRSPVIALFWCLIKFITTTSTSTIHIHTMLL